MLQDSQFAALKSPTAEILRIFFLGTIVRRKYLPKIFAVGLFSCDKFEETSKQKVIDLSKFKKIYFNENVNSHYFVSNEKKNSGDIFVNILFHK